MTTVADLVLTEHIGRHIAVEYNGQRCTGYIEDIIEAAKYPRFKNLGDVIVDLRHSDPDEAAGDGYHLPLRRDAVVTFLDEDQR